MKSRCKRILSYSVSAWGGGWGRGTPHLYLAHFTGVLLFSVIGLHSTLPTSKKLPIRVGNQGKFLFILLL